MKTRNSHVRENFIMATSKHPNIKMTILLQIPVTYHAVTVKLILSQTKRLFPKWPSCCHSYQNHHHNWGQTQLTSASWRFTNDIPITVATNLVITVEVSPISHQQVNDSHMALLCGPVQGSHLQLKSQRKTTLKNKPVLWTPPKVEYHRSTNEDSLWQKPALWTPSTVEYHRSTNEDSLWQKPVLWTPPTVEYHRSTNEDCL